MELPTEIIEQVKKLEFKDGDVLLAYCRDGADADTIQETMLFLQQMVKNTGNLSVKVVALSKGADLHRLSEMTMNRLGWYRR